ncbi:MAG: hypothetical protein GTO45_05035 [Candidatus Aminicenantes bacterium]|nr:hypothetical protein [Candidatus Aminicenantes bacterium]NIM78118.1 hypothetical protein [Candidatus Aminicenantes bacterium]NIN17436.1 hypothetical protein [Candidatus Aminicenantes bacterium]NIN41332.1 hypothetical protein [Candidatus Aminicenantes bacterium]NIN84102.1 hypothetical protein [Candidatus Aminicenantes bacterium]
MKKIFIRLLVIIVIVVIVFSPYLLVIDFERYSPFVLLVWFVSIAYYLWLKRIVDRHIQMKQQREEDSTDKEGKNRNDTKGSE